MLSEAVLVEWMDILSSAGVKVREFFKNFFAFFSTNAYLRGHLVFFFFSFLPAHPSVSVQPLFDLTHVYIYPPYFWSDCGLFAGELNFFSPLFRLYLACAINMLSHTSGSSLIWNHR